MLNKLTKKELIGMLAADFDSTRKEAEGIYDTFTGTLERAILEEGASFTLGTIGTFKVVEVAEREHHNPQTGEKIVKPAHLALKFKPSANLKRELAEIKFELVEE